MDQFRLSNREPRHCLFHGRLAKLIIASLVCCWSFESQAIGKTRYENVKTPEGWAWAQIKRGRPADFNARCGTTPLNPQTSDDAAWASACRLLPATFVVDVLTPGQFSAKLTFDGIAIIGARIVGDINLQNARMSRPFIVQGSRIEGNFEIGAARTESVVGLVGSRVAGRFFAKEFDSAASLLFSDTEFQQKVSLANARIAGNVDMSGATVEDEIDADTVQIGAHLLMSASDQKKANFKQVTLAGAKVAGNIRTEGSTFDGELNADSIQVGAHFLAGATGQKSTIFRNVSLASAKITGSVILDGASFGGDLNADSIQVGAHLLMRSYEAVRTSLKGVNLVNAKITGALDLSGSTVEGELNADSIQVGAHLLMSATKEKRG